MDLLDLAVTITCDDKATSQIEGISSGVIAKGTAVGNLVSQGITAAAGAVVEFGQQSIQSGMDFDSAMSQVAATMGLTTDQIGDLRDKAKEMGSSTSFSATEAAEALNYMALAGYDSQTSMEMLPTVLDLAAAGGMDLAAASDMITDSQTALGLSLDETTVLVDQMAQASSKSNTSVAQLGDAILTVGGTAKNLAGGMTEMNTVLGVMADNGIKGSEAGTHLRNMILSLSAPTETAATAMSELGVSATDAEGNLRPLEDVMQDFNVAFADMTQEEKTQALSKIFNKTDLAAVNALLDTSVDRWGELGGAIDDAAGAASKMAETQLDNLEGDITILQSAIEGAQIAVSELFTPALRDMAKVGSDGISAITEALNAGDFQGAGEQFATTITDIINVILEQLPQFLDMGMQMLTGLIQGFADALPTLIPNIVECIMALIQVFVDNLPLIIEAGLNLFVGLVQGLYNAVPVIIEALPAVIQGLCDAIVTLIPMIIEAGIQLMGAMLDNIDAILQAWTVALPQIIQALVGAIIELIPLIIDAGIQLMSALLQNTGAIISALAQALPEIIGGMVQAIVELAPMMLEAGLQLMSSLLGAFGTLGEDLGNLFSSAWEGVQSIFANAGEFFGGVLDAITSALSSVGQWFSDMFSSAWDGITNAFANVGQFFADVWNSITSVFENAFEWFTNIGVSIVQGVWQGIQSMIGWFTDAVAGFFGGIVDSVMNLLGIHSPSRVFAEIGGYTIEGYAEGIEAESDKPINAMRDMLDDMSGMSPTLNAPTVGYGNGMGGNIERNITFNVTINSDSDIDNAGRKIAESLYRYSELQERYSYSS